MPSKSQLTPIRKEIILSSYTTDSEYLYQTSQNLFDIGIGSRQFFSELEKELPPVFDRKTASKLLGNLISPKSMSNDDALGRGPKGTVYLGRRRGYTRDSFLEYLRGKIKSW